MTHGGDVYGIARRLGTGPERIADFSASINPLGLPDAARKEILGALGLVRHYPDPGAGVLINAVSERFGLDPRCVVAGNGSTELIYLIPRALGPGRVLVTSPAFSEYERAATLAGARMKYLVLKKKDGFRISVAEFISAMKGADMAFLCSPNNPTGDALERDDVLEIAAAARGLGCMLVVDEALVDFCPERSVLATKDNPYLIVLRSLTKFYALSGLRVGFGRFPRRVVSRLLGYKEPWSVNSLAQSAGAAALKDGAFAKRTLGLMQRERPYLEAGLKGLGIECFPSDANFYLMRVNGAGRIVRELLKKGIALRDCSDFRGLSRGRYIRVAVRSRRDNRRLIRELSHVL
jgi:threonine-phosphate decarboxylase